MVNKKEVAYVPIAPVKMEQIEAPKKIEEPQYPDKGIDYAGFSKTFFSGNEYRLNKQDTVDINGSSTFLGGETSQGVTHPAGGSKDFYCTKIILISRKTGAITNTETISIKDGTTTRLRLQEYSVNGIVLNFDFKVPLLFSKNGGIYITFGVPRAAGDIVAINMYGWIED